HRGRGRRRRRRCFRGGGRGRGRWRNWRRGCRRGRRRRRRTWRRRQWLGRGWRWWWELSERCTRNRRDQESGESADVGGTFHRVSIPRRVEPILAASVLVTSAKELRKAL